MEEERGEGVLGVARNARGHFLLHFYAALYRLVHHRVRELNGSGDPLGALIEKHPFLAAYLQEMRAAMPADITWERGGPWWEGCILDFEREVAKPLPLRALRESAALTVGEVVGFVLAGLVHEDSRFGDLFAALQGGARQPCAELIGRIQGESSGLDPWGACRPYFALGLFEPVDPSSPRAEWIVRVPGALWDAARGEGFDARGPQRHLPVEALPRLDELAIPDDFRARLSRLPRLLGEGGLFVMRGAIGSDRRRIASAVAKAMGRGVLEMEWDGSTALPSDLGSMALMLGAMTMLVCELAPGARITPPRGHRGPLTVVLGPVGGVVPHDARTVTLTVPGMDARLRRRQWRDAFGDAEVDEFDAIVDRFALPGGHIRRVAELARVEATLEGRARVGPEDVRNASRALNRQLLDTLAQRVETSGRWDDLVVAESTMRSLRELELRCLHRERLAERLGPAYRAGEGRGVCAMFSGGSGTGKTTAARVLAEQLGMDLYRVDLSAVFSKYVGETEKNLAQVLSRAEELDVILLLDEGDALLGRRTEARSAHDRYANLETNYLLQRLEGYRGILVATTNLLANIDGAFRRRMDVIVDFRAPDARQRALLWERHLEPGHSISGEILARLARRSELNGGQIRNAALRASLLALEERVPLAERHLDEAMRREIRKAGSPPPADDEPRSSPSGVDRFLDSL